MSSICDKATNPDDFETWCLVDSIIFGNDESSSSNILDEACGALYERIDEQWCDFDNHDGACCGEFADCCTKSIWYTVTVVAIAVSCILLCCLCCRCCCGGRRGVDYRSSASALSTATCRFEEQKPTVPVATATAIPSPITNHRSEVVSTVVHHPNGDIERRTETMNPDGSKLVEVVTERVMRGSSQHLPAASISLSSPIPLAMSASPIPTAPVEEEVMNKV